MQILPLTTPLLRNGDDIAAIFQEYGDLCRGDILVVSSKAFATVEGAAIDLSALSPTPQAMHLSQGKEKSAQYYQAVIQETERMNGTIIQSVFGVVLTELKPSGMDGSFLVPNAGLDLSNVEEGYAIGWPIDPVASVRSLHNAIPGVGVIMTDSGLSPRRLGVTAFALACAGVDPLHSLVHQTDLFGHSMRVTEEAIADQLATAGNFLMGNIDQSMPATIIRDHGLEYSDFCGWVQGIEREKDLYHGVI